VVVPGRRWSSVCRGHAPARGIGSTPVVAAEDEPRMAAADRDGLGGEAIAERVVAAGSGNQVTSGRPRRPAHRFGPGDRGARSSHFSLADASSGRAPCRGRASGRGHHASDGCSCWCAVGHATQSRQRGVASTYPVFDMPTI
jgi:hypothetical protein